jgi:hypothetical protein
LDLPIWNGGIRKLFYWQADLTVFTTFEATVRHFVEQHRHAHWDTDQVIQNLLTDFYVAHPGLEHLYSVPADNLSDQAELVVAFGNNLDVTFRIVEILIEAYLRAHLYRSYPNFAGFWINFENLWAPGSISLSAQQILLPYQQELTLTTAGLRRRPPKRVSFRARSGSLAKSGHAPAL